MTMRDLFNVATEHGMTVKLRPGDLKLCAIVCPDCQFGAELFDQSMEGYKREPYSRPVCTVQPQQQKEGLQDAERGVPAKDEDMDVDTATIEAKEDDNEEDENDDDEDIDIDDEIEEEETKSSRKIAAKGSKKKSSGKKGTENVSFEHLRKPTWKPGDAVPYAALIKCFEEIETHSGRLQKVDAVVNFFRSVISTTEAELVPCVYLCINKLGPSHTAPVLGIGDSILLKVIAETTGKMEAHV